MTAQIAGFVTRAQAGLRGPRSVSRNITPGSGGVAIHYGGPTQPAANLGADHQKCITTWRGWQNYHMNTHGWVDIAYTGGFCNHGYAFAGRGAGVRTAANGTNTGNQTHYAAVWIGGEGQTPTPAALDAADWWVQELRRSGAGKSVKPHRYFKSTGCPGGPLMSYAALRDGKSDFGATTPAGPSAPSKPTPKPSTSTSKAPKFPLQRGWFYGPWTGPVESVSGYTVRRGRVVGSPGHAGLRVWQQRMKDRGWRITVNGLYDARTAEVAGLFQKEKGLQVDRLVGPNTWKAAWTAAVTR